MKEPLDKYLLYPPFIVCQTNAKNLSYSTVEDIQLQKFERFLPDDCGADTHIKVDPFIRQLIDSVDETMEDTISDQHGSSIDSVSSEDSSLRGCHLLDSDDELYYASF